MTDSSFKRSTWTPPEETVEHTQVWHPDAVDASTQQDYPLMWLIVKSPPDQRGTILAIRPNQILGRGEGCDIRWEDERISRRHARFTLEPNPNTPNDPTLNYFIWPLEARKPIEVNQEAIRGAVPLQENDLLLMGDTLFVVKLLEI